MRKYYRRLLLGLLTCAAISANASTVSLTTGKAVGESIFIAVNTGLNVTLQWDNKADNETYVSDGMLHEVTVKGAVLNIVTDEDLTALYANDAGLTSIAFTDVPTLKRLFCAGNELTTLDLSSLKALTELDCQDNKLTQLTLPDSYIEDYNVAGNQLVAHGLKSNYVKELRSMVCAGNELSAVSYVSSMVNVRSLFCEDNQITSLAVSKCENLRTFICSNNKLTVFNGKQLKAIENLWLDGNKLDSVNLSVSEKLHSLNVRGNNMIRIVWNKACSKTLGYVDLSDNMLLFNSFPTAYSTAKKAYLFPAVLAPQRDYKLCEYALVDTDYPEWKPLFYRNGFMVGPSSTLVITDNNGNKLVSGKDYSYSSSGNLKFLTAHEQVNIKVSSSYYPDVTLTIAPFKVTITDGIELVTSEKADAELEVYTLSGVRVNNAGRLPKGVYIINGKKTVVK